MRAAAVSPGARGNRGRAGSTSPARPSSARPPHALCPSYAEANRVATPERMAGMPKEQGRKLIAQNRKARYDYHIDDTVEAGMVLVGTEVKSLRAGRATLVDGFARDPQRRGVPARRAHPGVHRGHLDQPRAAPGPQAAAQPPRDRQAREQGQRARLHADPDLALLQGRPRQGRDRPGPRQEDLRQAARPGRASRPTARSSRHSAASSRAWTDPWSSRRRWRNLSSDPRLLAGPRPPGSVRRPRALPAAEHPEAGLGAVRPRRPEDRAGVADPLPRQPRGACRAAPLVRRTPLLGAALRASPRYRRPTSTSGRATSPPEVPECLWSATFYPEPESAATSAT